MQLPLDCHTTNANLDLHGIRIYIRVNEIGVLLYYVHNKRHHSVSVYFVPSHTMVDTYLWKSFNKMSDGGYMNKNL